MPFKYICTYVLLAIIVPKYKQPVRRPYIRRQRIHIIIFLLNYEVEQVYLTGKVDKYRVAPKF